MTPPTKVTPISGFPELLPAERLLELHFLDVIREVFTLARSFLYREEDNGADREE